MELTMEAFFALVILAIIIGGAFYMTRGDKATGSGAGEEKYPGKDKK